MEEQQENAKEDNATGGPEKDHSTTPTEPNFREIRDVTDVIGNFGPWQRNLFFMLFCGAILSAWHNLAMTFLSPNVEHWCSPPQQFQNLSRHQWQNLSWPKIHQRPEKPNHQQCFMYNLSGSTMEEILAKNFTVPNDTSIVPCGMHEYDTSFYSSAVMSKFNVVCDREWMLSLTQSGYMLGMLTAVFVFGHLSDRFGRRRVMLLSICILILAGLSCAFSMSLVQFAISRYFSALGASGFYGTGFVLVLEPVGPAHRTILGISVNFGWGIGYIVLPGIAYALRNWFYIELAITLPAIILISYYWILPESPRWLLTYGKVTEAGNLLKKAAVKNGRKLREFEWALEQLQERAILAQKSAKQEKRYSVLDLFKTPNLRKKTLILYFTWCVNSFIYYGLSLNTNELGGDPFISFFIAGAVEFPSYAICILVLKYFGRRLPESVALLIGGIACLLTIPIGDELIWLRITLAMIGKFCVTASYGIIYLYSAELFPTVVRTIGVGSSSMCARIGSVLAPFVKELGRATHPSFPLTIFGGLSITSGLLVLLLPETNGDIIPDTIEEAEEFGKEENRRGLFSFGVKKQLVDKGKEMPSSPSKTEVTSVGSSNEKAF